jgi:hypothetical protein
MASIHETRELNVENKVARQEFSTTRDSIPDTSWEIYLQNEDRLLRDYPGQYAWIVGDNIYIYPNQYELCKAILETGAGQKGYTVKIEKSEPPVYEIPTPEVY